MDDAIKRVRQLAARALVRKEKLESELAALEAEKRQRETDLDRAISAEDDEIALRVTEMIGLLGERIEHKRSEVSEAEESYRQILADARAVQDAAKEHERLVQRAPIDAILGGDPLAASAEDAALENVRQHIEQLSAEAELNDELGASRRQERELSRKLADLEKQDAEARARAQLAELKAKKKKTAEGAPREAAAEGPPQNEPPKKPKKTM
jgi:phage shock protein A